ncbi:MAG: nucleoside 2-deoxyribosyltransferase [Pseudomonadota bacterium]
MRVYLAGPDVFLEDAQAFGDAKAAVCRRYGLIGCFPLDNALSLDRLSPRQQGQAIFRANVKMMDACQAVIANLTPFRGPSADVGTAWELGYMFSQEKALFAYSNVTADYQDRAPKDDGMVVEAFEMADNLMLHAALLASGQDVLRPERAVADPQRELRVFERCVAAAAAGLLNPGQREDQPRRAAAMR